MKPDRYLATEVELAITEGGWAWFASECGICGGEHSYSGGDIDSDPRASLGYRGHCGTGEFAKPEAGSLAQAAETLNLSLEISALVDADPHHTAELMESVEFHDEDVFVGVALKEVAA